MTPRRILGHPCRDSPIVDQLGPEECAVSSLRSPPVDFEFWKNSTSSSRNARPTVENNQLRARPMELHREYNTAKLANLGNKRDLLELEVALVPITTS